MEKERKTIDLGTGIQQPPSPKFLTPFVLAMILSGIAMAIGLTVAVATHRTVPTPDTITDTNTNVCGSFTDPQTGKTYNIIITEKGE